MTRTAHLDAVRALEDTATSLIYDAMSAVLARVAGNLAAVTAAAEGQPVEPLLSADDVAHLPALWRLEVDGSLLPWYRDVFDAGADAAAEQVTEMRRPRDLLPEVADEVDDTPEVLDEDELDDVGLTDPEPLPEPEIDDRPGPGQYRGLRAVLDDEDLDDVGLGRATVIDTGGDPLFMNESATRHLASARDRFLAVGDDTWAEARQSLLDSMARGDGSDATARRLREVVDVGRSRAAAVARTEVISAANAGSTARVRSMGADAPRYKQWLATMDARTRPTHRHADGQVVPLTDRFDVGGARLDYPGDPSGPDAEVIQCRCSVLYVDDPAGEDLSAIPGRQRGGVDPDTGEIAPAAAGIEPGRFVQLQGGTLDVEALGRSIDVQAWAEDYRRRFHLPAGAPVLWVPPGHDLADAQMVPGPPQVDSTTGEPHTGAMIALVPSPVDAERLADPMAGFSEPPEALHLTLLYLGESVDIPGPVASSILTGADAAAGMLPTLLAEAFGAGVWNPQGDPSLVLSVGGDGLRGAHQAALDIVAMAMADALEADPANPTSWQLPEQHEPWVAHVCLSYADDPAKLIDEALARLGPLTFDRLRVAVGGRAHDFPLVDTSVEMSGAGIQTATYVRDSRGRFDETGGGGAVDSGAGPDGGSPLTFGEGKNFDKAAADEFGEQGWSDWRKSATPQQRKAVRAYTDSGYSQRMNDRLRGVEPSAADRRKMDTTDKYVGDMTSAFDAPGAVTPQAVKVHRVMQGPIAEAIIKRHRAKTLTPAGEGFKGTHFRDKGFISTSTNRDIANKSSAPKNRRVTMEIEVPKGQRAIAPGSLSRFDIENEIVLPPGTRFEVREAGYRQGVLNIKVVIADD